MSVETLNGTLVKNEIERVSANTNMKMYDLDIQTGEKGDLISTINNYDYYLLPYKFNFDLSKNNPISIKGLAIPNFNDSHFYASSSYSGWNCGDDNIPIFIGKVKTELKNTANAIYGPKTWIKIYVGFPFNPTNTNTEQLKYSPTESFNEAQASLEFTNREFEGKMKLDLIYG